MPPPKRFRVDYIRDLDKLRGNLDRHFAPPRQIFVSKWDPQSFVVPDDIEQWLGEVFEDPSVRPVQNNSSDRPLSLILEGPSRTGKTAWARSLGVHNYISGHLDFNIKSYSNNVSYNVIDDVSPTYLKLKHWKELIGAQHDWQTNCKYGKPVQIKGGVPSILLCNPGEGSENLQLLYMGLLLMLGLLIY